MLEIAAFALSWIIWCVLHSVLISVTVTDYFKSKLGSTFRFYRISYNLFALATIIPICIWQPTEPFFEWEGGLITVQVCIVLIGGSLMISGAIQYDMLSLAGIRQIIQKNSNEKADIPDIRAAWVLDP